jgi:hypothetical protein
MRARLPRGLEEGYEGEARGDEVEGYRSGGRSTSYGGGSLVWL